MHHAKPIFFILLLMFSGFMMIFSAYIGNHSLYTRDMFHLTSLTFNITGVICGGMAIMIGINLGYNITQKIE